MTVSKTRHTLNLIEFTSAHCKSPTATGLPQVVAKNGGQNKYIERLTLFLHEIYYQIHLQLLLYMFSKPVTAIYLDWGENLRHVQ